MGTLVMAVLFYLTLRWEKEMDKLYKYTLKNWHKTGKVKKANGINGTITLAKKKGTKQS